MSTLVALARAQAVAAGRAQPIATVRHLHVHDRPLVLIPLAMAGEAHAPLAALLGTDRAAPRLLVVRQPRDRQERFAFAAALAEVVLPYLRSFAGATEAVAVDRGRDVRHRYVDAPQVWVPNSGGVDFLRLLGRSTRFRRTDGDHPVPAAVPLLGQWLTFLASAAEVPGSVLLADAGRVLSPGTAGTLLLVLAVASLAVATLLREHRSEYPLAVTGAVVGLVALAVPGHWESASPQLAVLGAALTGYGTVAGRDGARAAGCAALTGAAWLAVGGADVTVPEAWTLPAALALLLYSGPRLATAPSWSSWGPGLVTGFVPSVFLALVDPGLTRVLVLVAVATVTTTLATIREVQAPFVVGAGSLVVVAVGRLVDALPWPGLAAVAVAGALLLAVGASYENRRRQALGALSRVADMR